MKIRALLCLLLFWGLATGGGARAATGDANQDAVVGTRGQSVAALLAAR